jgi:hypothetical protein
VKCFASDKYRARTNVFKEQQRNCTFVMADCIGNTESRNPS